MEQKLNENTNLQDVIAQFKDVENSPEKTIPYSKVIIWMQHDDLEVIGALYSFITKPRYYTKITPNLSAEDYSKFIMNYLRRCILENPSTDWANSRYEAGWDFVNWFNNFWNDPSVPKHIVNDLKKWLEDVYRVGNSEIRECINIAILEHLFENKEISKAFSDWKNDPLMVQAFEESMRCAGRIKGPQSLDNLKE